MHDVDVTQQFIRELKQMGCRFALDDFGAGFSSFYYLKRFDVDYLKIDGGFVRDLATDEGNRIFVKALCDVARALNKQVVAEWVENRETLAILTEMGTLYGQGYLFHRPAPLWEEVPEQIALRRGRRAASLECRQTALASLLSAASTPVALSELVGPEQTDDGLGLGDLARRDESQRLVQGERTHSRNSPSSPGWPSCFRPLRQEQVDSLVGVADARMQGREVPPSRGDVAGLLEQFAARSGERLPRRGRSFRPAARESACRTG